LVRLQLLHPIEHRRQILRATASNSYTHADGNRYPDANRNSNSHGYGYSECNAHA
jgi:hypothetical protein